MFCDIFFHHLTKWKNIPPHPVLIKQSYPQNLFQQLHRGRLSQGVRAVEAGRREALQRGAFVWVRIRVTASAGTLAEGHIRGGVSEADHLLHCDTVSLVEVHQPVEGAEGLIPDAVLTAPLQHSEMLHPVAIAAGEKCVGDKVRPESMFSSSRSFLSLDFGSTICNWQH